MNKVDFIETNLINFSKILRPEVHRTDVKSQKKTPYSSIKIEKSFVPERKSTMSETFRPEIDKLKQIYKKKLEEEKRMKALLAEGKITREQFLQEQKPKRVQQVVEAQQKVTIDQSGQVRDQQGNILFMKNRTTDLLINKKKDDQIQLKSMIKKQKIKLHQRIGRPFLDRNLIVGSSKRRVRRSILGLQFLDKGSYQPIQHKKEVKEEIEQLNDILQGDKGNEQQINVIKKRSRISLQFNRDIPKVEWWDSCLLDNKTYQTLAGIDQDMDIQTKLKLVKDCKIEEGINWNQIGSETFYQKVGVSAEDERIVLPMFLTKQEQKKLKRKRKHQKLLEKNDQIKLGLIEPDKPKLRVANMAIVMKNQFILDPSKVEAEAKKQTEERINKHLQSNGLRKLTKTQKKDKAIRKLKRDSAKECRRAVFRVRKLLDPTHIFKVNMNAKQLALNGLIIKPNNELSQFPALVLIEGGIRAVKFYKNLMINRIRWSENDPSNGCGLVWEGEIQNSTVGKWKMFEVGDEVEAIRLLTEKKCQNFWQYMSQD